MRVLVYGGRDFLPTARAWRFLAESIPWETREVTIISGGAAGADSFGEAWAAAFDTRLERYKPDWVQFGKGAGHIRNQQMLDTGIDLALEFPGRQGTADMRARLDKAGVPVIQYEE